MDMFELLNKSKDNRPLAERMRPETLDEFIGQKHILEKNKMLYRAIMTDNLSSIILYGPPGTGKTTLAMIIANTTKSEFRQLNAVSSGVSDIKKIIEEAQNNLKINSKRTILFIDEIHRFNKLQQDALLPYVERGIVVLIGATTENPYFEVNKALLSRSMIFELKELTQDEILDVLKKALESPKGLKEYNVVIDEEALKYIAFNAGGDVRRALNALEMAVKTSERVEGKIKVTLEDAYECIQKRVILYDKNGDYHYDLISAFIKSMRGTDPDAAIYYLAKLIESGEDPMFIARRIMICASEDVGNADPMALVVATNAATAVSIIGFPEARIILAQAAAYVACAPKSNACYLAIDSALEDVRKNNDSGVPPYLRDAHYKGANKLSRGIGYKYPHDYNGYVKQDYLPASHIGKKYYIPKNIGYESKIKERLNKLKEVYE
ncbi:MAG: putative helicase subunit of Holliday junction resolvase [Caloramator sp.]|jgi:putative ATPase|uniref:replication-associated recombination protein A n=1 Tax=Caloramator sp. TaxID=1871330 RepID=UPI001E1727E2|nr:replication-associated recombination protein A [Caloramator sp.]MBZ4662457.1 putative helicase subunit of Holliday junction resolvase [Caloramator sp.]